MWQSHSPITQLSGKMRFVLLMGQKVKNAHSHSWAHTAHVQQTLSQMADLQRIDIPCSLSVIRGLIQNYWTWQESSLLWVHCDEIQTDYKTQGHIRKPPEFIALRSTYAKRYPNIRWRLFPYATVTQHLPATATVTSEVSLALTWPGSDSPISQLSPEKPWGQ